MAEKKTEFRIVPNAHGKYTLERWSDVLEDYVYAATVSDQMEARSVIDQLKRETIYLD